MGTQLKWRMVRLVNHDFTQLVADALECKEYNKVDHAQIRSWDHVAKYSIDDDQRDLLEDNGVDTYEKYCINKDEVTAREKETHLLVEAHLRTCQFKACIALRDARVDIGAMKL